MSTLVARGAPWRDIRKERRATLHNLDFKRITTPTSEVCRRRKRAKTLGEAEGLPNWRVTMPPIPLSTDELNAEPALCDVYHEAGHAVIGVVQGLRLDAVAGIVGPTAFPYCKWDHSWLKEILDNRAQPGAEDAIKLFTEIHADMCLAAKYAEALVCDITSYEQQEAFHCDALDAECRRRNCGLDYFGLRGLQTYHDRAKALVAKHQKAIKLVADELHAGHTLNHDQVAARIAQAQAEAPPV